jgi:hypothetical protein
MSPVLEIVRNLGQQIGPSQNLYLLQAGQSELATGPKVPCLKPALGVQIFKGDKNP